MTREELEHVIKAASQIVGDEIVVVGSQAVLGQFPDAPASLLRSQEADVFPRSDPSRADEIDGSLGDGSQFHATNGYYAHGVGPETVHAPAGWEERLERLLVPPFRKSDPPVVSWSLDIHDLLLAKLVAGRSKDIDFVLDALRAELTTVHLLRPGLERMTAHDRSLAEERLDGVAARLARKR